MNTTLILALLALVCSGQLVDGFDLSDREIMKMLCVTNHCDQEISYAIIRAEYKPLNKPAHLQLNAGDHVAIFGKMITQPYDKFWEGMVIDPDTKEAKSERGVFPKAIARELMVKSDRDKLWPIEIYVDAYFSSKVGTTKPEIKHPVEPELDPDFMASEEEIEEHIAQHKEKQKEDKEEDTEKEEDKEEGTEKADDVRSQKDKEWDEAYKELEELDKSSKLSEPKDQTPIPGSKTHILSATPPPVSNMKPKTTDQRKSQPETDKSRSENESKTDGSDAEMKSNSSDTEMKGTEREVYNTQKSDKKTNSDMKSENVENEGRDAENTDLKSNKLETEESTLKEQKQERTEGSKDERLPPDSPNQIVATKEPSENKTSAANESKTVENSVTSFSTATAETNQTREEVVKPSEPDTEPDKPTPGIHDDAETQPETENIVESTDDQSQNSTDSENTPKTEVENPKPSESNETVTVKEETEENVGSDQSGMREKNVDSEVTKPDSTESTQRDKQNMLPVDSSELAEDSAERKEGDNPGDIKPSETVKDDDVSDKIDPTQVTTDTSTDAAGGDNSDVASSANSQPDGENSETTENSNQTASVPDTNTTPDPSTQSEKTDQSVSSSTGEVPLTKEEDEKGTSTESLATATEAPPTEEKPLSADDNIPSTGEEAPPRDKEAPPHNKETPHPGEESPSGEKAQSGDEEAPSIDEESAESETQPSETDSNLKNVNDEPIAEEGGEDAEKEGNPVDEEMESLEQENTTPVPEEDPYDPRPPTGDQPSSEFTTPPPTQSDMNEDEHPFDDPSDKNERLFEDVDEGYDSDDEQEQTTNINTDPEIPNVTPQPDVQEEDNSSTQQQEIPTVEKTNLPVITGPAGKIISYNYPLIQAQLEPGLELHMWIIAETLPPAIQEVLVSEPFGLPAPIWIEVALIVVCLTVALLLYTTVTCVCVTCSNLSHNSKLKSHLKELNVKLEAAQAELSTNTSDNTEQAELVERARLETEQIKESKELLETQLNDLKSAFDKLEDSKSELVTDLTQKSTEIESARVLIAQWNEYGTNMENAKTEWADEKVKLSALIEQQTKTHQKLVEEYSDYKKTTQNEIQTLNESVQANSGLSSETALKYEEQIASLESNIETLKKEKSDLSTQLEKCNTRLDSIQSELDSAQTEITSLRESCDNKDEELSLLKSCVQTISNTTDEEDDSENKSEMLNNMMETAKVMKELESVKEKLEETRSELEQEKSSRKSVEGDLSAVKYDNETMSAKSDQLLAESTAAKQNLSYMTELYEKANKTIARLNAARESDSTDASIEEYIKQINELKQEITSWRQRHEEKETEYKSSEKDLRKRTMDSEKKAHDSWMVLRDTERKVTALKAESQALKEANLAFERENLDLNETNKNLMIELEIERSRQHRLDDRSDSASIEFRRRRPERPASRNSVSSSRYGGLRDNNSMSPYDKREKENEPLDPLRAPPPMHAYSKTGKKKEKKKQRPAENYSPYSQEPYCEVDNGSTYGMQPPVLPGAYMNPGAMPDQILMDPNMMNPGGMMAGMLPPGQMPPGQMPPGQMPPGQMPPGQMPPGQMPPGQMPPGQMPPGQMPSGQMPPGHMPHGMMMDPTMMQQQGMMTQGGMMDPNMMANMSAIPPDGSMNWTQDSGLQPNITHSNIPHQNQQTGYENHPSA